MKRLKHIIPCIAAVALAMLCVFLLPTEASAETEGYYTYSVFNDEATITGCDNSISGDITIPSTLGGYPVTGIDLYAFSGCSSLTSVIIGDSVTSINDYAFSECSSLTSVIIGDGVTSIRGSTFWGCSNLTSVIIGDSVTSINYTAFTDCSSLTGIWVNENNHAFSSDSRGVLFNKDKTILIQAPHALDGSYTVADTVTSISNAAFRYCKKMTSVTIADTVTSIGNGAFWGCSSLTSVAIADTVTSIGHSVFYGCSSLTSVTIGDSVPSIGEKMFYGCSSLTSVTIGDSVTRINGAVFYGCSSLTGIWVDENNPAFSSDSRGVLFNKDKTILIQAPHALDGSYTVADTVTSISYAAFRYCKKMTSVTIANTVTSIGNGAFWDCSSLTSVTISDSVTSIGSSAFSDCSSLTGIWVNENNPAYSSDSRGVLFNKDKTTLIKAPGALESNYNIPASVTTISMDAFYGCTRLTGVTIPDSVNSIDDYVFCDCSSLTSVTIGDSVTSIGFLAFKDCTSLTSITMGENVYSIGEFAFDGCSSLTSITMGENVYSIGESAFSGCSSLTSITMGESVREIEYKAFSDCTALERAIYTGTSEQWSKIELDDGNDALVEKLVCVGDVRFSGASLTLQDDLTINYRVSKALIGEYGYTSPYVVVSFNGVETTLTQYTEKEDCLEFRFVNIAPNQMHDTLYATLYATYDGIEYSGVTKEYSVAEYCYSMLEQYSADEYSELRTLLVDLLNYGAAAQTYTNYKTATPVNAALTETQRGWGTSTEPALQSVLNTKYKTVDAPTAKWKGAGLLLQESVTMRLALTAQDVTDLSVRIESGENTWTIPAEQFEAGDGKYYVYFTGLNAGQMRDTVYLTIYEGDTAVSNTASYSIESYACEMQNSEDAKLVALLKAMMRYGDAANAYAN